MIEVGLDRALADRELAGDLLVGLAVGHQAQCRHLARRQLHARHPFGQLRRRGRREVRLAREDVADAADQIVGGNVLQHVRLRARFQRARDLVVGVVGRQHDDAGAGIALANLPDGLDAFHDRHAQIEERDVRVIPLEGVDGLDAVAGFGDHAQVGLLVDDVRDAGSEQRVIVDEQHARRSRYGGSLRWQRAPAWAVTSAPRPARPRCRSWAR